MKLLRYNQFRDSQLLTGTLNGARYEREQRSDRDVEIPPALLITDERGGIWSFGTEYNQHSMEFNVIRNDVDTGATASRIVYRRGVVTIFGRDGMRRWNGKTFL